MGRLNAKQTIFVQEYLKDKNGARAALAAGYSAKSARQIADQNLSKLYIKEAIDAGLKEQADACKITAEMIIGNLKHFAFGENIAPKDRIKATELLGKHFKLFTDVQVHTVDATVTHVSEEEIRAIREKIKNDC